MRTRAFRDGTGLCLILIGIWSAGCASTRNQPLDQLLGSSVRTHVPAPQAPRLNSHALTLAIQSAVDSVRHHQDRLPLEWSEAVASVATRHSHDMAQHAFFSHTNQSGLNPNDRAREANLHTRVQTDSYVIVGLGENLFLAHLYHSYVRSADAHRISDIQYNWKTVSELAQEAVRLWMESPLHRKNLLSPVYRSGGIGIAFGSNDTVFITCNFSAVDNATLAAN